ncbi:MAG TPA: hypothetical protein VJ801_04565 [Polyangia bacterium]|nr:hypothetical protein [Polyangia bacterium]
MPEDIEIETSDGAAARPSSAPEARPSRLRALATDVTADPARWGSLLLVALASSVFAAWLLNFGRHQWFVTDEFDYFNHGPDSLIVWLLQPHNEHTIVFTKVWYAFLGQLVGLRHYELYMIPLVASHLVVVAAIYRLTWISTSSRVVASGTALVSLTMGAAVGTLTWAGQFQYVGSVAAGLVVLILALESSGKRALAIVIATALFGTLNGSAFVAFGLTAAIVYARRRMWTGAIVVAAIPLGWEAISHFVWAPQDIYAATGLGQILREGPAFAYSILDAAISQTLPKTHLSVVVLAALVVSTLTLLSVPVRLRRTAMSGLVVATLAMVVLLTLLSLVVARLSLPAGAASGGQYSYLVLVSLVPIGGILVGHVARSRAVLVGAAGALLVISLIGGRAFLREADALASWKTNGAHLMQAAAAELNAGMPTFPDQLPVPDTAPTVSQERLRSLTASGQLDTVIATPADADQASLNMQWRLVPTGQPAGACRDLSAGQSSAVPMGTSVSMIGLNPGAAVDLQYTSSYAVRKLELPSTVASLETVSQRAVVVTAEAAPVRVCLLSSG